MTKSLKDILNGIKASKVVPGSTGSDPGVDYAPKAPDEQEFVKKHTTEKHADRVGNGDDIYQATNIKNSLSKPGEERHGRKKPSDKAVYEAAKCNMTEEGTACPVHEMADCTKSKPLREIAKNPYAIGMAAAMKKTGDKPPLKKSTIVKGHDIAKAVKEDLAVPLLGGDDESAEMAKTQLRALANKALHLAMQLNDDQIVEPWVQSKIAVAKDYVTAVHDYMIYGDHAKDKKDEQSAPYEGGIDMSGAPTNTFPSFSADVNTGRNV